MSKYITTPIQAPGGRRAIPIEQLRRELAEGVDKIKKQREADVRKQQLCNRNEGLL